MYILQEQILAYHPMQFNNALFLLLLREFK